jgi:lysophospholipase L1-like esterase
VDAIGRDLVELVLPLVERDFHASPVARDRALIGTTMGGYQAATIGLNRPGLFGSAVSLSANFRPTMDLSANFAGLGAHLAEAKASLRYVGLFTGLAEASNVPQARRVHEHLAALGVPHEWATPYRGAHTWHTWRSYLRQLLERKLFVADPYATAPITEAYESRFEKNVRAYEAGDREDAPPAGAVLLVGDSQFFRWKTVREDLAGYTVVNRGIDGLWMRDLDEYAERLVLPYRPRLVVLHAGGNDVHNGRTPEQVLGDFQSFVAKVRRAYPRVPIAFSSLTPGPGRWDQAEKRRLTNKTIKDWVATQPGLSFVDLWDAMLTPSGQPREDLWVEDRIHPNHAGYLVRVKAMKKILGKPERK